MRPGACIRTQPFRKKELSSMPISAASVSGGKKWFINGKKKKKKRKRSIVWQFTRTWNIYQRTERKHQTEEIYLVTLGCSFCLTTPYAYCAKSMQLITFNFVSIARWLWHQIIRKAFFSFSLERSMRHSKEMLQFRLPQLWRHCLRKQPVSNGVWRGKWHG